LGGASRVAQIVDVGLPCRGEVAKLARGPRGEPVGEGLDRLAKDLAQSGAEVTKGGEGTGDGPLGALLVAQPATVSPATTTTASQ
jgi:hypothetical protein